MSLHPIPKMVMPSDRRPCWRNGIIQIHITRACNLGCFSCTQGSQLAGKPAMMTVDQFRQACVSIQNHWGVAGVFGGNPAVHPDFEEMCEVMRGIIPWERRGIWCNAPLGKAKVMRVTFNPAHSNLNVHMCKEAYEEFATDWPESIPFLKGLDRDSIHTPPFVAIKDVIHDESKMWDMIKDCDINKYWSSLIGVVGGELKAYFCELAYAQAAMHAGEPDWPVSRIEVTDEWWKKPQADFEAQIRQHCPACGIPLRRPGQLAIGGDHEEFSATHATIARPKRLPRKIDLITIPQLARPERPATEYLEGVTPGYMRS